MIKGLIFSIFFMEIFFASSPVIHAQTPEDEIVYDRGGKEGPRLFLSATKCRDTPCIVTQDGAIKISPQSLHEYKLEIGLFHEGVLRPVHLFQQASTLDERLAERLFNTQQNRKIFNLSRFVEEGNTEMIHIYGLTLHYEIDEGDPLILTLTRKDDAKDYKEYYFRYHQDGSFLDADLALLQPIGIFIPNPNNVIQGSNISVALSLSRGWYLDPEVPHGWLAKISHAWRGNLFLGLMSRQIIEEKGGNKATIEESDGFIGIGVTLLDFMIVGVGINVSRPPQSHFPFVGMEVGRTYKLLRSLKRSTHEQWVEYQKKEQRRAE